MNRLKRRLAAAFALGLGLVEGSACIDEPTYGAVSTNTGGQVFTDAFGSGVDFQAFQNSKYDAISIDTMTAHSGRSSLKVTVPDLTDPSGGFAGGAFTASEARNLSAYSALTLWVKASQEVSVDLFGVGNDNTGTSKYTATIGPITVGTEWQEVIVPIPDPHKLTSDRGLFFFAASAKGATPAGAFTLWLDDVQFQSLGADVLGAPTASIGDAAAAITVGQTTSVHGATVTFPVHGVDQAVDPMLGYFDFTSSDPKVATVGDDGTVTAVSEGSTEVTATLGAAAAKGTLSVKVVGKNDDVIALLSANYPSRPVEKWLADWSQPMGQVAVANTPDGTDPMETYTNLQFAGIEFVQAMHQLDLTKMTRFHVDLNTSDDVEVHLKLVDFGANQVSDPPYDGAVHGDDSAGEIVLSASSTPPLKPGEWTTIDLPLTAFQMAYGMSPGLTNRAHVAQIAVAGPASGMPLVSSLAIKNLYFSK